jgi:hypothetical protein
MTIEILKDAIRPPAQNNLTWIFPVRLNGRDIEWKVDSFDLSMWFKEAVGRYPRNEKGDQEEREDIRENWSQVEPRLRVEAEREAALPCRISVEGMRFSASSSEEAQSIPKNELPPLSDPQREAAKKMGLSEEAYARSLVAGERTWNALLEKTKRLAEYLQQSVMKLAKDAKLETVILRTLEEKFDIDIRLGDRVLPVRVREELVDDFFETGSEQAERSLNRVLEVSLPASSFPRQAS